MGYHGTRRHVKQKAHIFEGLDLGVRKKDPLRVVVPGTNPKHGKNVLRSVNDVLTAGGGPPPGTDPTAGRFAGTGVEEKRESEP
jgi:hypothetical protein